MNQKNGGRVACRASRDTEVAVDIARLANDFGFAPEGLASDFVKLKQMESEGIVDVDGQSIAVTELGRPFVRSICATFDTYLTDSGARLSRRLEQERRSNHARL